MTTIRQLPPELARIAKDELNEDPKRLLEDIQLIKEWLDKQPYLKARTDDQWLVAILRGCKFSLEKVKKKLDLYYTLRTTASDITRRLKPTEARFVDVLKLGICVILPKSKDILAPRVILIRPGFYDPDKYSIADILCVFYYLVQILVNEDDTSTVIGTKILVDYHAVTLGHLAQATPALLKKMIAVAQDSMPLRLKGSHHINLPPSIETVFTLVKSLINEKARQRLRIHKTTDELKQQFSSDIIPTEYNGSGGSIPEITDAWVKKISEYRPWMQLEENLGTDETKRPGKPHTAEEIFGIQGSFRKLDLD